MQYEALAEALDIPIGTVKTHLHRAKRRLAGVVMTCREVQESIEAIAAGDEPATGAFRAHVETCARCAAALATARRIEESLAARPAPAAPARFAATVVARIRREHWRAEQQVDRMFNIAVGGRRSSRSRPGRWRCSMPAA